MRHGVWKRGTGKYTWSKWMSFSTCLVCMFTREGKAEKGIERKLNAVKSMTMLINTYLHDKLE